MGCAPHNCLRPANPGRGPKVRGAKARGSPLPLRPKTDFRAKHNTPSPSRGPLERVGALDQERTGALWRYEGPLDLDCAPGEEPIGLLSSRGS